MLRNKPFLLIADKIKALEHMQIIAPILETDYPLRIRAIKLQNQSFQVAKSQLSSCKIATLLSASALKSPYRSLVGGALAYGLSFKRIHKFLMGCASMPQSDCIIFILTYKKAQFKSK
jgi:hypothetical protein